MNTKKNITIHTNTPETLFGSFNQAIQWNSIFYTIYKICFLCVSFSLYYALPTQLFTLWATANSLIFLVLLWFDCGLRKSIPLYAPLFAQDKKKYHKFIIVLIISQIFIFLLTSSTLFFVLRWFAITPLLPFWICFLTCFTERITAIIQLLYHARFLQKQFNSLNSLCIMFEMFANLLAIYVNADGITLLRTTFITKIVANIIIILVALIPLRRMLTDHNNVLDASKEQLPPQNFNKLMHNFLVHSGIMWVALILKSLSERNFLYPFIKGTTTTQTANFFKLTLDGALFFQRIALKSIDTADTVLLSYVKLRKDSTLSRAFSKIILTTLILCIPLFFISIVFFFKKQAFFAIHHISQAIPAEFFVMFLLIAGSYMLEIILSPYERILEVQRNYSQLFKAYTPYILGYGFLIFSQAPTWMTLFQFIALTQVLRLVSSCLMAYYAQRSYQLPFPVSNTCIILGICCIISLAFIGTLRVIRHKTRRYKS